MRRWLAVAAVAVGGLAGGTATAFAIAAALWNVKTARIVARLHAGHRGEAPSFSYDELVGLPDPVVRYFEFALTPGQSLVRNARIRQSGEFAMRADSWMPFAAVSTFRFSRAAFFGTLGSEWRR